MQMKTWSNYDHSTADPVVMETNTEYSKRSEDYDSWTSSLTHTQALMTSSRYSVAEVGHPIVSHSDIEKKIKKLFEEKEHHKRKRGRMDGITGYSIYSQSLKDKLELESIEPKYQYDIGSGIWTADNLQEFISAVPTKQFYSSLIKMKSSSSPHVHESSYREGSWRQSTHSFVTNQRNVSSTEYLSFAQVVSAEIKMEVTRSCSQLCTPHYPKSVSISYTSTSVTNTRNNGGNSTKQVPLELGGTKEEQAGSDPITHVDSDPMTHMDSDPITHKELDSTAYNDSGYLRNHFVDYNGEEQLSSGNCRDSIATLVISSE